MLPVRIRSATYTHNMKICRLTNDMIILIWFYEDKVLIFLVELLKISDQLKRYDIHAVFLSAE